jgi:4-phospho-D-threonate 3-dehydrogenase / 4-phospho-D-erythronate 3-dehydrogenase
LKKWNRNKLSIKSSLEKAADFVNELSLPTIGITMGDASGIGPEIIMKCLGHTEVHGFCRPLVIGDAGRLREAARIVDSKVKVNAIHNLSQAQFSLGIADCIDLRLLPENLPWGRLWPICGDAAYQFIVRAVELAKRGEIDAICTAPLNKEALHAGGHIFPGHTGLLAQLTSTSEVSMMLSTPRLRVIHVTSHLGLIDAIGRIEPGLVERTIARAQQTLIRAGFAHPRIGVCGINPHAGEHGLFGRGEEESKIEPAVRACRARGWQVEGPLPADTLFFRAGRGEFDIVVAMYHEEGVNITVGLPVIRTSVDHGTAFDIAGTGIADERSLLVALKQAAELVHTGAERYTWSPARRFPTGPSADTASFLHGSQEAKRDALLTSISRRF